MLRNLYFPSWTNDGDELSWNSNHASLNSCVVKFLMPISSHIWLPSLNLARESSLNDADFVTLNLQILRLLDFWRRFVGRQALTGVEKVVNSRTYSFFFLRNPTSHRSLEGAEGFVYRIDEAFQVPPPQSAQHSVTHPLPSFTGSDPLPRINRIGTVASLLCDY